MTLIAIVSLLSMMNAQNVKLNLIYIINYFWASLIILNVLGAISR